uniref:Uncharacterized protein n=1 Tax=Phytophthora ramorum TaxID=164328 RepID=H3H886_PHYRM
MEDERRAQKTGQLDAWLAKVAKEAKREDIRRAPGALLDETTPEALRLALALEQGHHNWAAAKAMRVQVAEALARAEERSSGGVGDAVSSEHKQPTKGDPKLFTGTESGAEVVMPEPRGDFRDALEEIAVGRDAGHYDTRDDVTKKPVMVIPVLEAIAMSTATDARDMSIRASRTRRRFEKRVRKARAREQRRIREWLAAQESSGSTYATYNESSGKRKPAKQYCYYSSSRYKRPSVGWADGGQRPVRVGALRAVRTPATETLPTARVKRREKWCDIKLDTGAQYTVAGESWKQLGVRQEELPPVDYVEGFTGNVSRVLGVWRFKMETQYGQTMSVNAL